MTLLPSLRKALSATALGIVVFTCVDLGLPLKRQVITIFANQHV